MRNFKQLLVWQRSHAFAVRMTQVASRSSARAVPGFASQVKRAASSIPANIAEGAAFDSEVQFAHYLSMAIGSAHEMENHLEFGRHTQAIREADAMALLDELIEIRRMLYGLRKHVRGRIERSSIPHK